MWSTLAEVWKRLKSLLAGDPQVQVSVPTPPQGGKIKIEVELEQRQEQIKIENGAHQ